MKKYKLLRCGHCYITKNGDFSIVLLGGNKRMGYTFQVSHVNRDFIPGKIHIQSRIVPNDGYWWEFPSQEYANVTYYHEMGWSVTVKV